VNESAAPTLQPKRHTHQYNALHYTTNTQTATKQSQIHYACTAKTKQTQQAKETISNGSETPRTTQNNAKQSAKQSGKVKKFSLI